MTTNSKNHFWNWFEKNHEILFDLPDQSEAEIEYWTNELNSQLKAHHESFDCILEYENEEAILTISVGAQREFFKQVDELIAEAPAIPGWIFNALIPPDRIDHVVEDLVIKAGIDPEEFRFSFRKPEPGKRAEIVVFHPSYTPENDILVYEVADQTIFNLLGERSFGNNIEEIDVANISTAETDKLEKLNVLATIFNSGIVVTGNGSLVRLSRKKK